MATRPIDPADIPKRHIGRPRADRQGDVKAFLRSNEQACEVVMLPGEKPSNVYAAYHVAVAQCHAEELIRVTRRYDRIFLIRQAPFTATGQTRFKG